jgi:2'-5' RNA ligase
VLLPDAVRARVDEAAAELRRRGPAIAWVRAENFHVTLRFLGSADEAALARVREALAEAARATAPFTLSIGGFGGFPSARTPRVVWVAVGRGAEPLAALHARLEAALARRGFPPEGRAFHGHVTLGRARDRRGAPDLAEWLGPGDATLGEVLVEAVHLMRSDLHPAGARYGVLAREALGGASDGAPR